MLFLFKLLNVCIIHIGRIYIYPLWMQSKSLDQDFPPCCFSECIKQYYCSLSIYHFHMEAWTTILGCIYIKNNFLDRITGMADNIHMGLYFTSLFQEEMEWPMLQLPINSRHCTVKMILMSSNACISSWWRHGFLHGRKIHPIKENFNSFYSSLSTTVFDLRYFAEYSFPKDKNASQWKRLSVEQ